MAIDDGGSHTTSHDMRAHLAEAAAGRMVSLLMLQLIVLISASADRWQVIVLFVIYHGLPRHGPVLLHPHRGRAHDSTGPGRLKPLLGLLYEQILLHVFIVIPGRNVRFHLMGVYRSGPPEISRSDNLLPINVLFRRRFDTGLGSGTARHVMVILTRNFSRRLVHRFLGRGERVVPL